uniref:Protein CLP1 homolog n=1 Tax=Syphacia muris TaxID=451379 RepID=A0A0N5A978_9BILA
MEEKKSPTNEPSVKEFTLKEDNELRFEVGSKGDVTLELIEGKAEVFGSELVLNKKYTFGPGSRVAVFTWSNAVVELVGDTESAYLAEQTPMVIYLNTHAALEQLREHAETAVSQKEDAQGPIIMIVGPTDVGKTTLCRILCNYAVRQGRTPIYVDLDVGQGSMSVPGTVGALYIEKTADVVEGFDKHYPLIYHFGHLSPSANIALYDLLVDQLADAVKKKMKECPEANFGGLIINTCGWIKGDGYQCITHAATSFEVSVVVVLDHERLFNELQRDLPTFVKVLHQPKSGGVENRSREMRIAARNAFVHKYFYGTRAFPLYPYTFDVPFDNLTISKVGTDPLPPECLPYGVKPDDHRTKVFIFVH